MEFSGDGLRRRIVKPEIACVQLNLETVVLA